MTPLQADTEVNNRVKGLSKPEWLLLGLTLLILMCGVVGLSVIQIQEIGLSFFWDPKAILISALVCIALASIKPRSANKAETYVERLLWSAKYVTFFLTFSMVGSALFEENAKAIGPMLALALHCYLYCSALGKLVVLGLIWAFSHHFIAGIRFLLLDLHIGAELTAARKSSALVLILSLALTVVMEVFIW